MVASHPANISSGDQLVLESTKLLPEPMLINHQWVPMVLWSVSQELLKNISRWLVIKNYTFEITATSPGANEFTFYVLIFQSEQKHIFTFYVIPSHCYDTGT